MRSPRPRFPRHAAPIDPSITDATILSETPDRAGEPSTGGLEGAHGVEQVGRAAPDAPAGLQAAALESGRVFRADEASAASTEATLDAPAPDLITEPQARIPLDRVLTVNEPSPSLDSPGCPPSADCRHCDGATETTETTETIRTIERVKKVARVTRTPCAERRRCDARVGARGMSRSGSRQSLRSRRSPMPSAPSAAGQRGAEPIAAQAARRDAGGLGIVLNGVWVPLGT